MSDKLMRKAAVLANVRRALFAHTLEAAAGPLEALEAEGEHELAGKLRSCVDFCGQIAEIVAGYQAAIRTSMETLGMQTDALRAAWAEIDELRCCRPEVSERIKALRVAWEDLRRARTDGEAGEARERMYDAIDALVASSTDAKTTPETVLHHTWEANAGQEAAVDEPPPTPDPACEDVCADPTEDVDVLRRQRNDWCETAAQFARNEAYWRERAEKAEAQVAEGEPLESAEDARNAAAQASERLEQVSRREQAMAARIEALREAVGELDDAANHSSMNREQRLLREDRIKNARIRIVRAARLLCEAAEEPTKAPDPACEDAVPEAPEGPTATPGVGVEGPVEIAKQAAEPYAGMQAPYDWIAIANKRRHALQLLLAYVDRGGQRGFRFGRRARGR